MYGLIFMVPIAPFGIFGSVFQASGGMVVLAYLVGALGMAFTAASYAQMSRAFPVAGSVYTYAGRGIAQPVGFLAGWMVLLDYVLVPGLLYLISGVAMNSILPAIPVWAWVAAFVVLNTVVNYFGIETTARINKVMLVAELVVLAIFLVVGIVALANGAGRGFALTPLYDSSTFSLGLVFGAVSIAVLSFLGFDGISTLAEENRESARTIGRSMIAALAVAGLLFVVQTWVAALLVPDPQRLIAEGDAGGTAFYDAAAVAGGAWLSTLTAVATAIAWGFANSLVAQAATSRLLFAMARDRQLPSFLRRVHPAAGAGQRDAAGRRALARARDLHEHPRRRHHPAVDAGQLRRAVGVPRAARVRGGALPGPPAQPGLVAPPRRPGDRVRDPRLRRGERPGGRADPRVRLARARGRGPRRAAGQGPPAGPGGAGGLVTRRPSTGSVRPWHAAVRPD